MRALTIVLIVVLVIIILAIFSQAGLGQSRTSLADRNHWDWRHRDSDSSEYSRRRGHAESSDSRWGSDSRSARGSHCSYCSLSSHSDSDCSSSSSDSSSAGQQTCPNPCPNNCPDPCPECPDCNCPEPPDPKITICHYPPGQPENPQTLSVSVSALTAHFGHGDTIGPCPGD